MDAKFQRIQFTADTLPGDVIGLEYFNVKESEFKTRLGPIFANIVLVDEINRAVPRTQSSLLEVMEERTVTIAKQTHSLPEPFFSYSYAKSTRISGHISVARCSVRPVFTHNTPRLSYERS